MTTGELESLLRAKFSGQEWALIFGVRNGTGYSRQVTRTADAMAMSLWPSRGLELHGFELKVSRSDWKRELAQPAKAEELCRFCDRWWLVVADEAIVQAGELPPTWGLLAPKGGKLAVKKEPEKLTAQPIDRLFLAALLRAAQTTSASVEQILDAEKRAHAAAKAQFESNHQYDKRKHQELRDAVSVLEKAVGPTWKLSDWNAERFGEALRLAMALDVAGVRKELEGLRNHAKNIYERLERELAATPSPGASDAA